MRYGTNPPVVGEGQPEKISYLYLIVKKFEKFIL
jgi:hypothetical protein